MKKLSLSLLFLISIFCCQSLLAAEYVISVYDSVSSQNLINVGHKMLRCEEIFTSGAKASNVRVHRIASHSVDYGVRNDNARGMQIHERGIDVFEELAQTLIARVIYDYRASGHYADAEVDKIFETHRSLSPHRLKLLSVESVEENGFPQMMTSIDSGVSKITMTSSNGGLFSALRIYDSSPVMKSFGRKRQVPEISSKDTLELAERVFPGFDLTKALADRGIQRSEYTWSLGLGDISGKQESGLRTLFAQAADLLDLHYNDRDYFNLNRIDALKREDVDVVFYANEKLVPYYQKTLELEPLLGADGSPLFQEKNNQRYSIFHIKGSDFIAKYFDLRFHQPLYGNGRGLQVEMEIRQYYMERLIREIDRLDPEAYKVKDLDDFFVILEGLIENFVMIRQKENPSEQEFFHFLAQLLMVRRSLPDDIFVQTYSEATKARVWRMIERHMGPGELVGKGLSTFAMLELILRDPIQFLINRTGPVTKPN